MAFSPDGQTALTGSFDNTARLWEVQTGQPRGAVLKHEGYVKAVAFSPDGQTALTGSADGTSRLWDVKTGRPRVAGLKHLACGQRLGVQPRRPDRADGQ